MDNNIINIFAVSDSVGETAEKIAIASSLQFQLEREITRFSRVTKETQVAQIIQKAKEANAIIIYTIVKQDLIKYLETECLKENVTAINLMLPLFKVIEEKTGQKPMFKIGLTHQKDAEYFRRIKAIEWTIEHDNGQNIDTINEADLIILGIPSTSKTPLSMHLANLGIKVANYNLSLEYDIAEEICDLRGVVPFVGLTLDIDTLIELRRRKLSELKFPDGINTVEDYIAEELDNAYRVYARLKCLVIDVTSDDIEQIGNTITHKFKLPLKVSHYRF